MPRHAHAEDDSFGGCVGLDVAFHVFCIQRVSADISTPLLGPSCMWLVISQYLCRAIIPTSQNSRQLWEYSTSEGTILGRRLAYQFMRVVIYMTRIYWIIHVCESCDGSAQLSDSNIECHVFSWMQHAIRVLPILSYTGSRYVSQRPHTTLMQHSDYPFRPLHFYMCTIALSFAACCTH